MPSLDYGEPRMPSSTLLCSYKVVCAAMVSYWPQVAELWNCSVASSSPGKLMDFNTLFIDTGNAVAKGAMSKFMVVMW